MSAVRVCCCLLMVVGCKEVRLDESLEVDMSLVNRVVHNSEQGDLVYRGIGGALARVEVSSWGRASRQSTANRNQDGNTWDVGASGSDLVMTTGSAYRRAGVDIDVDGPDFINITATAAQGMVHLSNVVGNHNLEGTRVQGEAVYGQVRVVAGEEGVELGFAPDEDSNSRIDSEGSVILTLPQYLPYDLRIFGVVDENFDAIDLGFDEVLVGEDYTEAWRHPRTARLDVYVTGILELRQGF